MNLDEVKPGMFVVVRTETTTAREIVPYNIGVVAVVEKVKEGEACTYPVLLKCVSRNWRLFGGAESSISMREFKASEFDLLDPGIAALYGHDVKDMTP